MRGCEGELTACVVHGSSIGVEELCFVVFLESLNGSRYEGRVGMRLVEM